MCPREEIRLNETALRASVKNAYCPKEKCELKG